MRRWVIYLLAPILISLSGCCLFVEGDEALLKEIRVDLIDSIRPSLVEALDKAKEADGSPTFINELKTEKVNLLDQMVDSIDRVYPPLDEDGNLLPFAPVKTPWEE